MKLELFSHYFKDKRVTKMGFGPNGRSFGDILFLVQQGAHVLITDYRDEPDIQASREKLLLQLSEDEKSRVTFVLGEHRIQDFTDCDYVLKASGVPLDSEYIKAVNKVGVPVHTSSAWLFQIASELLEITTIGVTGTKGKSTVTDMIEHICKASNRSYHVAGNVRGVANLPVLEHIQSGDILVAELDSWQLQGFGEAGISPQISVFTNFFEDHLNYYGGSMELYFKDKSYIYKNQDELGICFVSKQAFGQIQLFGGVVPDQVEDVSPSVLPEDLVLQVLGDHNRENAALAYAAVQQTGMLRDEIVSALGTYVPMEGRLRHVGEKDGIHYYDDNNSTTPTSTYASLIAIREEHPEANILWFGGGADKEFEYLQLAVALPELVSYGVLFAGAATDKILFLVSESMKERLQVVNSMEEAWTHIDSAKQKGDVVVLSPGAASFGVFLNEYERGDQYNEHIKKI